MTRGRAIAAAIALAIAGAPGAAAAQDGEPLPSLDELESVEALDPPEPAATSASDSVIVRSASRVDLPLTEAPAIVSVITAAELRALGARTLYEALRYSPELDVTRDAFGFYHVAVRGRKADPEVLVLLDGKRLNDFYDGRILYELPISLVERIEIIRGPGSALHGTNAFAGVISIYSRQRATPELRLQLASGAGDRDLAETGSVWGGGGGGGDVGPLHAAATIEVGHDGGPRLLVPEDSLTRNRMDPDTGASQSLSCDNQPIAQCPDSAYSSFERTVIHASGRVDARRALLVPGDAARADVHALYLDRGPFIGEFDTLTPDSRLETARVLASASYELPLTRDGAFRLAFGSAADFATTQRDIQVAPDGFKELVEGRSEPFPDGQLKSTGYSTTVLRQDARLRWTLGARNTLVAGAEVEHMRMPRFSFATNYDDAGRRYDDLGNHWDIPFEQDGQTRTVLGVSIEDLWTIRPGLSVIAGGRYDHYSDFGSALSPRVGAVWRTGDLALKLFYGWAFRAPTFEELYDETSRIDLGQFTGNPDLDASRIRTLEAQAIYLLPLDEHMVEVALTAAHSSIRDSIDRAPLTGLSNQFLNTSDIESTAASAEVRADLSGGRASVFANASWQSATSDYRYVDPDAGLNFVTTTALVNVPRFRFNAGGQMRVVQRYSIGAVVEAGTSRHNNQRTPLEAQHFFDYPPYALVEVFASADRLWDRFHARIAALNVTGAHVEDEPFRANRMPQGIPRDRRQVTLVIGLEF